jgi:hypothetical protein
MENVLKNVEQSLTGIQGIWQVYATHNHEYAEQLYMILILGEMYRDVILKFYEQV